MGVGETATEAGSMHRTGIYACYNNIYSENTTTSIILILKCRNVMHTCLLFYFTNLEAFPIIKGHIFLKVFILFILDVSNRLSVVVVVDDDGFTVVLRRIQRSVSSSCARSCLRR